MEWCSVQSHIHCQDKGDLPSFWVGRVQDQARKRVKQKQTLSCQQLLMDQHKVLGKLCKYVAFVLFLNASPASFLRVVFPQLLTFHLVYLDDKDTQAAFSPVFERVLIFFLVSKCHTSEYIHWKYLSSSE